MDAVITVHIRLCEKPPEQAHNPEVITSKPATGIRSIGGIIWRITRARIGDTRHGVGLLDASVSMLWISAGICNNPRTPMAQAFDSFAPTPFPTIPSTRLHPTTSSRLACLQLGDLGYPLPGGVATAGGMKLSDYLVTQQLGPAEFARQIGVGRMTVHRYIRGERFPRPEVLQRIHHATAGQVTPNDFLNLNPPPAPGSAGSDQDMPIEVALVNVVSHNKSDDEDLVGRPLYPWSRLTADEQQVLDDAYDDMMEEPPEGFDLSPTLQAALDTLGQRAAYSNDQFTLDGQVVRITRLVEEANVLRRQQDLPLLRYPGVKT